MKTLELRREVHMTPAYDKRHPDPQQDYGIGSVSMFMVLRSPIGATAFTLYTHWSLPHIEREFKGLSLAPILESHPENTTVREAVFRVEVDHGGPHLRLGPSIPGRMGDYTHLTCMPLPADLGYHSSAPIRDWQSIDQPTKPACEWLDGRPCWYDGSVLNAEPVYQQLLVEGDAAVWRTLEASYRRLFGAAHALVDGALWLDREVARLGGI